MKKIRRKIIALPEHPPKVYAAFMTQQGTDAPTASVLQNTLGGEVVWTRLREGQYLGTLSGAFTEGKTAGSLVFLTYDPTEALVYQVDRISDDAVQLNTYEMESLRDGIIADTFMEIRVYPETE